METEFLSEKQVIQMMDTYIKRSATRKYSR